jgi:PmbA protein
MSTKHENLMDLATSLVEYGRKKGASEIEVSISQGSQFKAAVRDGDLETLTESGPKGLQIRVFVDNKAANASSSDFTKATLTNLVDNAIVRAKLSGTDPFAGVPDLEKVAVESASLRIFDPAIVEMVPEKKIGYAKQAEAIGLRLKGVNKSLGSSFVTNATTRYLANSKGFANSYASTVAYSVVGFEAGEGTNLFQDYWFEGGTTLAKMPEPEVLAKTAANRVTRLIGARKVPTQNVPVVVEPSVAASLLLGLFSGCINGPSIAQRRSFLVDKLGQQIASELVTIVDDGLMPAGFGTVPFDSEGVPSRKNLVVDKGVLKTYLLDTYHSRKLKMPPTGNSDGTTNFFLAAGTSSPEQIISSVDRGLLLTGTIGLGTDPTTGDISMGAFGLWIEKGQIAFPVAEITISANLATILKGIDMVGNDLVFHDQTNAPTIKVAEMTIGGTTAAS